MSAKAKKTAGPMLINSPFLLNGEAILAEGETVLKFNSMSNRGSGIMGSLYVTNFKLAFMTTKIEKSPVAAQRMMQASTRQLDDLLADEESRSECDYIPLTSMACITAISTIKQLSKKLRAGKTPSRKYDIIEITCKDLRVVQYNLSHCKDSERARVINTMLVYAFPTNVQKLFAFDYARGMQTNAPASAKGRAFHTFRHEKDLELELARLRAHQNWRVSKINQDFSLCKTLPELIKVPTSLSDDDIRSISDCYIGGRVPTLVWCSRETGAALLSSSAPRNEEEDSNGHSQQMIQGIKNACLGDGKVPVTMDATLILPSLKELQSSYNQLFEACLCRSWKDFWSTDSSWLGKVDNSRWLEYVKMALTTATDIANVILIKRTSVIVHDTTGHDYACLLVSLVQIMTDPYFRTVVGLQSLIQKEWVTKGHPFSRRLSLVSNNQDNNRNKIGLFKEDNNNGEASPVFILFLDCVHQLWTQFPSRFGYTEHFLLLLIDSVYMCLFETFLFDSEYDRRKFKSGNLVSVWDFFSTCIPPSKFKTLFLNPLYNIERNWGDAPSKSQSDSEFFYSVNSESCLSENVSSANLLSVPDKKLPKSKGGSLPHSFCLQYQSHKDPNISVINPDSSSIHIQLWHKYFLRWTPTVDLCKGSSFDVSQHLQQVELLEELKYLEDRRHYLRDKLDEIENPTSDAESISSHGSLKMRKTKHESVTGKDAQESYIGLISNFTFCNIISSE